jgi:hypothetical protein
MNKIDKSEIISRLRGQQTEHQIASCPVTRRKLIQKTLFRPSSIQAMEKITPSIHALNWYEIQLNGNTIFSSENFSDVLAAWDK